MNERDRLIEELNKYANQFKSEALMDAVYIDTRRVANFIIADRKRIVEPLIKRLKEFHGYSRDWTCVDPLQTGIEETLKLAGITDEKE